MAGVLAGAMAFAGTASGRGERGDYKGPERRDLKNQADAVNAESVKLVEEAVKKSGCKVASSTLYDKGPVIAKVVEIREGQNGPETVTTDIPVANLAYASANRVQKGLQPKVLEVLKVDGKPGQALFDLYDLHAQAVKAGEIGEAMNTLAKLAAIGGDLLNPDSPYTEAKRLALAADIAAVVREAKKGGNVEAIMARAIKDVTRSKKIAECSRLVI